MKLKVDKMNHIIQRELSDILQNDVKNANLGFCTVTEVSLTNDMSIAKVYVSFITNKRKGLEALENSKGYIRSQLSRRINLRRCPELQFVLDTSLQYGNRIDKIIESLNEDKDA